MDPPTSKGKFGFQENNHTDLIPKSKRKRKEEEEPKRLTADILYHKNYKNDVGPSAVADLDKFPHKKMVILLHGGAVSDLVGPSLPVKKLCFDVNNPCTFVLIQS